MSKRRKFWRRLFSKSYTLMLVPHSKGSAFSLKIRFSLVMVLVPALLAFSGYGYSLASNYLLMKSELKEMKLLKETNARQKTQLESLASKAEQLEQKLPQLQLLQNNARAVIDRAQTKRRENLPSRSGSKRVVARARSSRIDTRSSNSFQQPATTTVDHTDISPELPWSKEYLKLKDRLDLLLVELDSAGSAVTAQQPQLLAAVDYLEAYPSGWPVRGTITSPYGVRRSPFSGGKDFHHGVDIAADYGSPVIATASGVVEFVGYKGAYGKTIIIKNKYGFTTLYSHHSKIIAKKGDVVKAGDTIAKVGSTGLSTGPHVHYEVFVNGDQVDPTGYLNN